MSASPLDMTVEEYPQATNDGVSIRMRGNRRRDTKPEVAVRSALHRRGLRFRVDHQVQLSGRVVRADIVFPRKRLAVFIDGCFWHQCPIHATLPQTNTDYWLPKLERNVKRDRLIDRLLDDCEWSVLRAWEHEAPGTVADRIVARIAAIDSDQ
jgi:DNA mismatch endonuclease (patch repair protein)